jgi:hypothetical protein
VREIRLHGSEGGAAETNRSFLPLSIKLRVAGAECPSVGAVSGVPPSSPFALRKDFCVPFCGFAASREVRKDRKLARPRVLPPRRAGV